MKLRKRFRTGIFFLISSPPRRSRGPPRFAQNPPCAVHHPPRCSALSSDTAEFLRPCHPKTEAGKAPFLPFASINGYSALQECVKLYLPNHSILEFRSSFQHISPTELPLLLYNSIRRITTRSPPGFQRGSVQLDFLRRLRDAKTLNR